MVEKPNDADQEIGGMELGSVDGALPPSPEPDRPELCRLMEATKDGRIDVVVMGDHIGSSEDPSALANTLAELDRLGVAVLTVAEPPAEDEVPG